jgi:hypothetical protein
MGALGDVARDFVEVELHHVGVGVGHREGRPDPAGRADRAEQIGVVIVLVGGLPRPRSAPGPLSNLAVLLADAGLLLKPGFDWPRLRHCFEMSLQRAESFMEWAAPPFGVVWSPAIEKEEWVWLLRSLGSISAGTSAASSGRMRRARW